MQSQSDWRANTARQRPRQRLRHSVDPVVGDDPEVRALWAAAANAERDTDSQAEHEVGWVSLASGEVVRLTVHEGSLSAGMTGVVVESFRYSDCELVMVQFGPATRVVPSTALEPNPCA